jgi:hypothetical protein
LDTAVATDFNYRLAQLRRKGGAHLRTPLTLEKLARTIHGRIVTRSVSEDGEGIYPRLRFGFRWRALRPLHCGA